MSDHYFSNIKKSRALREIAAQLTPKIEQELTPKIAQEKARAIAKELLRRQMGVEFIIEVPAFPKEKSARSEEKWFPARTHAQSDRTKEKFARSGKN